MKADFKKTIDGDLYLVNANNQRFKNIPLNIKKSSLYFFGYNNFIIFETTSSFVNSQNAVLSYDQKINCLGFLNELVDLIILSEKEFLELSSSCNMDLEKSESYVRIKDFNGLVKFYAEEQILKGIGNINFIMKSYDS